MFQVEGRGQASATGGRGVAVGVDDGATDHVGEGEGEGKGVDVGSSVGSTDVGVAEAVGARVSGVRGADRVAVGGGLVAVGSTAATSSCSCIPRATATKRVKAMSHAAINPLHSEPNPLPAPPDPL